MKTKEIFKRYESLKTFNDYLNNGKTQPAFSEHSRTNGERFTGTTSYEEAEQKMMRGDSDLQKKIEDAGVSQARINVQKQVQRRQSYSSVVGAIPNVPAYISGAPNSMIAQRTIKTKKKVLNIGYSMTVLADVDKNDIIKASAKVVSAILNIEASGVRVNLYTLFCTKKQSHTIGLSLKVKDASRKIDTLRMSYPMAHSSFLRRQCFRWEEVTENVPDCYAGSYGYVPESKEQAEFFKRNGMKFDKVLTFGDIVNMSTVEITKMITGATK
jgi:hypothetical protein|nr:MAG TPA: hypothetical protein [Caudoviricetes sp.]